MRLNQFIAHAGVCSRRNADELIKSGKITVNGVVNTTMGYVVVETDVVKYDGKLLKQEQKVYVLLNKPKDFITTTADESGRKTVLDLVLPKLKTVTKNNHIRIYPVGRLDRNTTGLLLLTNDGELAQSLTHPSFEVEKIYYAELDKPLTKTDFEKILAGLELEDGLASVDQLAYPDPKNKKEVGIAIHSGRNRIVRRIFEHLQYDVVKLDRVVYAGLTKKDLARGQWRMLTDVEIRNLKFFSKKKKKETK